MIDFIKTTFGVFWYSMVISSGMFFGLWLVAVIIDNLAK